MGMSSSPFPRLLTGAHTVIENTWNHTLKKKKKTMKERSLVIVVTGIFFLQVAQGEAHKDSDPATGRTQA